MIVWLEIEIVIGQLFLQASLFQKIVDGAAFAQIGLGNFYRCLGCFVSVCGHKVIFYIQLLFASAHKVNSRLRLPLALLISTIVHRVKKIFSID